jgi:tetratricopeptide (TPR) repeat protein
MPSKGSSFLLKAITFILFFAILVTVVSIAKSLLVRDKLVAPRTELERAEYTAVQATKANPNDPKARIKLAAVYLEKGNAGSAIKEALNATRLAPDNAEAFYVLGLAYKGQGDLTKARSELVKAAKTTGQLAPFYQTCWMEVAKIDNEKKDYKSLIKDYDAALGFGPENAPILYEMGLAYEKAGDKQGALTYYKEALTFVPDYQEAISAADRLAKDGVKPAAAKASEKPVSAKPGSSSPATGKPSAAKTNTTSGK